MNIQNILIEKITPSLLNPRKTFDDAALQELAANIEKQGLLQPITVRPSGCTYEIVCGERRFRALSILKAKEDDINTVKVKAHRKKTEIFQTIPCIVREMTDDEAFDAMITENLQRKDVDPIEEAFAFSQLIDKGRSPEDIAIKFGKSTRFIFDRIKLNNLIPEYKSKIKDGSLPISSAMILCKLAKDKQIQSLDDFGDCDSIFTGDVKDYVKREFMALKEVCWIDDDTWPNGDFKPCSDCSFNTANHGCLFYEMSNTKNPHCTNAECFSSKMMAYILRMIESVPEIVKSGESLDFGKSVVIGCKPSYISDSGKEEYDKYYAAIENMGIQIVNECDVFSGKSWANKDQLKEKIEKNEVYKCVRFWDWSVPKFKIEYYNIKKENSTETSALASQEDIEINNLKDKLKRIKELAVEKSTDALRKMAQEKSYFKRKGDLSENEQIVFDSMILRHCTDDYLKLCGLSKWGDNADFFNYSKDNQADRYHWYRDYMRNILLSADVTYHKDLQKCQNVIFREQYPDDYKKLSKDIVELYDKKRMRIIEKMKELGYNEKGEKEA